nr:cystathionine gamma-lyase-like [Procambarus clarkii]XP_045624213.1 cystathionine gamma-lyase-like [Procambarus clarkii]XP_045624220.1 cystathionine gamma-lyase-like [Procambarus clarkii]XP_045624227.1 cystathionine gamma-lyase-like [Procambarus clarkii]XP_045624233.1 cystathionine gamma-lyase-like [Procambarus clarkii]
MSELGYKKNDPTFSSRAIHEGNEPEQWNHLAVVPLISLSTTYKREGPSEFKLYKYGRSGNPTRHCLEKCLASAENAKHCLVTSSGMAAVTVITQLISAGEHIIATGDIYSGTNIYFNNVASRMGIEIDFVDAVDIKNVEAAFKPNTKMVWIESATNPTMKIVDIAAVAAIVKKHTKSFLAVDNTFMSPYFQRPLDLGADLVMHSITKYINGHTDVIMGAVCTNRDDLHDELRFLQNAIGFVPSPLDCYLVNRSLKTLALRMEQHMKNGLAVARFLETHPCVEKVIHPGLPSHPQHELSKRQCYGHSGMFSFCIKGNSLKASTHFCKQLKMFTFATSLGGVESLCQLPSVMSHECLPAETREKLGITDGLVRVSCGLEPADDLIKDLDQALRAVVPGDEETVPVKCLEDNLKACGI